MREIKFKKIWKVGTEKNKGKKVYVVYKHRNALKKRYRKLYFDCYFGDDKQYAKDTAEALNEMEYLKMNRVGRGEKE